VRAVTLRLTLRQVGRQLAAASAGPRDDVETLKLPIERGLVGLVEEAPQVVIRNDVVVVHVAEQVGQALRF
jgi:hypothetical protein